MIAKRVISLCAGLLVALATTAGAAEQKQATANNFDLTVSGIKGSKGNIMIAVYNSKKTWLGDKEADVFTSAKVVVREHIQDGKIQTGLSLPPGEYAVSVFHDQDGDEKMRTNFIGIPKDPMGLSNNAKAKFGPPKYKDARFQISEKTLAMDIELGKI